MSREYSFTLTVPVKDLKSAEKLIDETRQTHAGVRISRKTDRDGCARFYISFPFTESRPDLKFKEWFEKSRVGDDWDLFGPTHGRWGLV